MQHVVQLSESVTLPALGQGTWRLGDVVQRRADEVAALRAGIEAGMTVIDTAEMYGSGRSEKIIAEAIRGLERDKLFIVSKVLPENASRARLRASCAHSLRRLEIAYIDLYLLHWRGGVPLAETVAGLEELVAQGHIRHWGVSNFDVADMTELWRLPQGRHCVVNEVLYHLGSRGIEYDLLPWMAEHKVMTVAYCPIAQAGELRRELYASTAVQGVARRHQATVAQVLLAFAIRSGRIVAIPKSSTVSHTRENAAADRLTLSAQDMQELDAAFPPPTHKVPLDIV